MLLRSKTLNKIIEGILASVSMSMPMPGQQRIAQPAPKTSSGGKQRIKYPDASGRVGQIERTTPVERAVHS